MPYWPKEVMRAADNGAVAELKNVEEARQIINTLAQQNKMQGHLLAAWKRRLKEQNELIFRLHREREEQMRLLGAQLLLLEANLRMKQQKIEILLQDREETIDKQQDSIKTLEKQLSTMMSRTSVKKEILVLSCRKEEESLDDSDSAVVLEDCTDLQSPTPGAEPSESSRSQVKVIRSISDVLENLRKQQKNNDFPSEQVDDSSSDDDEEEVKMPGIRRSFLRGSLERCPQNNDEKHNRIYSNHRSVTRPRDVKLKKNHKTKSLEELRHRLKYWQQSNIDTELPE